MICLLFQPQIIRSVTPDFASMAAQVSKMLTSPILILCVLYLNVPLYLDLVSLSVTFSSIKHFCYIIIRCALSFIFFIQTSKFCG